MIHHCAHVRVVFYGVGLALISIPSVGVVVVFLPLTSFLRPLPYTGLIVVFSICSVLSNTLSSSTGVLHLCECSAVLSKPSASSSSCPGYTNQPSFTSSFSPAVIRGSEILGSRVCLFVFYALFCLYLLLLCVSFPPPRLVVYFHTCFQL